MSAIVQPTRAQEAILRFRSQAHILSSGSRGSAKTTALMLDIVDRCCDPEARPLVVRESHAGLLEIQDELYEMLTNVFGSVRRNKTDGQMHLPNGATVTFTQINDIESYSKHQGKSYCSLYLDEFGNYTSAAMDFVAKLRSNLRTRPGLRPHIHATANPFGRAHARLMRQHIVKAPFWHPYMDESGEWWINCHTSYKDNVHIDVLSYERQLIAAANGDPNLLAAWEEGRWDVLGGSMFAPPFDPAVHVIKAPQNLGDVRYRIGADFGLSAPSVGLLLCQLKNPVGYMRQGSILVLDEVDTCVAGQLHLGDGSPPQVLADMFKEMLARNDASLRTPVVIDDMRGLNNAETVVSLLRENQISAYKPHFKNRVQGWVLIKSLMHNAVTREGPGLWIADRCVNLLQTLPEAPRSPNRPSDLDPRWAEDHHCDALSYGVTDIWGRKARSGTHWGMW